MIIERKFTKGEIERAGNLLRQENTSQNELEWAENVLENLRAMYAYPLNTFQSTLRDKLVATQAEKRVVAQRLKRSPSIISKLQRFPQMNLSRMQDIGGLRAILENITEVRRLEENYRNSRFQHELVGEKDYINTPQKSGYRGIHLIYKYKNKNVPQYDGLLLELQFRTKLQHIWATSVETVGTFISSSLKSSKGPQDWLEFFALVGTVFAIIEKSPRVPGFESLSEQEIYKKVAVDAKNLKVIDSLQAFNVVADRIKGKPGSYHLLLLDLDIKTVSFNSYGQKDFEAANKEYSAQEQNIKNNNRNAQVVLVSTSSVDALKKAYPNYFLDTVEFIKELKKIIKRSDKSFV